MPSVPRLRACVCNSSIVYCAAAAPTWQLIDVGVLMHRRSRERLRRWAGATLFAVGCWLTLSACDDEAGSLPVTAPSTPGMGGSGGGGTLPSSAADAGDAPGVTPSGNEIDTEAMPPVMGIAGATGSADAGDPACAQDTDFDGVPNCMDGCPSNFAKTAPGVCGCGQTDLDSDADGTLDCQEQCPQDANKTVPGECGCGQPDIDGDGDGALDCNDECPSDAALALAGTCGCSAPEDLPASCLRHRYSFDGTGTIATDSVGGADGVVVNTTLSGDGTVVLAGTNTEQYVDLPDGILSSLGPSATIEAWVTWTGLGGPWQRVFDFGSSDQAEDTQSNGATYLFVTPSNGARARVALTNAAIGGERIVEGLAPITPDVLVHVAVVIDGAANTLTLFQNGVTFGSVDLVTTTLAGLNDVNNWVGRSQFVNDEELQGTLHEVRIYSTARSAQLVARDAVTGPDELIDEPPPVEPPPDPTEPDAG
jgi:hypothetical protein